ncbi:hypothetical protein PS712_05474 [Pseudomonas fluorescens]|uniref:Uncharacterized protein n=1 Tax=Pseudomonas fluorescens TaxID=294 RepID=A0A5E7FBC4_PSEFL|nr:hypothetical protein PS712_05474 [Pseudomonas fluorescens]
MKGKRKVKTEKWLLRDRYVAEARQLLANRSHKAHRFLDVVLLPGTPLEPIGRLAGDIRR